MIAAAAAFGAILGSFLNALLFRYRTGRSVLRGRSRCMHCGHGLRALDLVPVLSFLLLRGRCRYCQSSLSWQYPLVELGAAGVSAALYVLYPDPYAYFFWLCVWMTLLFILVYDLRHMIIPTGAAALLGVLSLCYLLAQHPTEWWSGVALALPLFLLSTLSRGRWMGWGDWQVELSLGWLLGFTAGLTALMLAFWIGAAVGIAAAALSKKVTMKSEIPFAPFLIAGAALTQLFHVDFFQTLPLLFLP